MRMDFPLEMKRLINIWNFVFGKPSRRYHVENFSIPSCVLNEDDLKILKSVVSEATDIIHLMFMKRKVSTPICEFEFLKAKYIVACIAEYLKDNEQNPNIPRIANLNDYLREAEMFLFELEDFLGDD